MSDRDQIEIRSLRLLGVHGLLPEERRRPQPFELDLDVVVDLAAAGSSDDLSDSVDYGAVTAAARQVVEDESFGLLEALADHLSRAVLAVDPRIAEVTVAVRKLHPPVPADLGTAGVRIRRSRPG